MPKYQIQIIVSRVDVAPAQDEIRRVAYETDDVLEAFAIALALNEHVDDEVNYYAENREEEKN